jgi:hypothetical protein
MMEATLSKAASLGISITLSCRLDLNWDFMPLSERRRSGDLIAGIGESIYNSGIATWFASYRKFAINVASLCRKYQGSCKALVVADGLEAMWRHETQWRSLLGDIRKVTNATLVVSSRAPATIGFHDATDMIGVNTIHTSLFAAQYTTMHGQVIDQAINCPWPTVEYGSPVKVGKTIYATGISLSQCQAACDASISRAGSCSAISYNAQPPRQCYLWTHVMSTKTTAGGWVSYSQVALIC